MNKFQSNSLTLGHNQPPCNVEEERAVTSVDKTPHAKKRNPTSKRQNCRFLTNCHKTMFPRFGAQSDQPTEWPRQKANWPICAIHEYRILSCSFVRNRLRFIKQRNDAVDPREIWVAIWLLIDVARVKASLPPSPEMPFQCKVWSKAQDSQCSA